MPATPPKADTPRPSEVRRPPAAAAAAAAPAPGRPTAGNRPPMFAPLRTLLKQRVQLERRGFQIHLVLAPPLAPAAEAPVEPTRGAALRHDHRQLVELLKRHADLRHTLRHLACVEQTLAREGSRALKGMPAKVLRKAVEQIEGLQRDEPGFALPELMRRLNRALALIDERAKEFEATEAMDISEASHSLFDEMERSWNGRMPDAK